MYEQYDKVSNTAMCDQSIIYLPEKNNTSRTQRLQNNSNKCPKNPEN